MNDAIGYVEAGLALVPIPAGLNNAGITTTVSGFFTLAPANPNGQDYVNWHGRDTMTWVKGRHTMNFGGEYRGVQASYFGSSIGGPNVDGARAVPPRHGAA